MSSGRKSISSYYSKVAPQTILKARDFLTGRNALPAPDTIFVSRSKIAARLSAAELAALSRAALGAAAGTARAAWALILVAEDQSALFEVIG